ncbi:MAG: SxtJ family membrane protein [Planctomycetota bacterium]|jgi:carbamoyltransferase
MTAILGISALYHDSAAAVVVDGRIAAAAQEERFTRSKHDHRFPVEAIRYCLEAAGLKPEQLDYVGFYDKPLLKFERLLETYLAYAPAGFRSFRKIIPSWIHRKLHVPREIRKALGGRYQRRCVFPEHHQSHAASAFYPSPFDEAAILTLDGVGEWTTASFGHGRGNRIELLGDLRFPHSLGLLYSAITYFCGFKVNSGEHKLMGLAPYGRPKYKDLILDKLIDLKPDGSFRTDLCYFNYCQGLTMTSARFDRLLGGRPRTPESPLTEREMDLAASIQKVSEEVMLRAARHVYEATGMQRLCMAGGVALNCVGNGRILREGPFDDIWIQPAAGDAGGALGAALFIWHQLLDRPRTPEPSDSQLGSLLGPEFSDDQIRAFLDDRGAPYRHLPDRHDLCRRVAEWIAAGKVVGWMQGRAEFGPRALGNRSILGDARSPAMQSVLNLKIKFRESFRPFAPAVLRERASEYFQMPDDDRPYMLVVDSVAEGKRLPCDGPEPHGLDRLKVVRSEVPAVTHVDYSARIQTVDEPRHGPFYGVIKALESQTGCPVVINTSFNVRGEPIVCSPDDAYRCFMATGMDVLAMGSFVLLKDEQPETLRRASDEHVARFRSRPETIATDSGSQAGLVRIDPNPSRRRLAVFGVLWLVFLGLVGGGVLHLTGSVPAAAAVWTLAAVVPAVGWLAPAFMRIAYLGLAYLSYPFALALSHLVLATIYYLVLTPIGLLMRLFGYDPMNRRLDERAATYWHPREKAENVGRYFRQF